MLFTSFMDTHESSRWVILQRVMDKSFASPFSYISLVLLLIGLSGCLAHQNKHLEVTYNLYPANQKAGELGFIQGTGHSDGHFMALEVRLPSGEVITGQSTEVAEELITFGGVYAQAMDIGEPTSLSPSIYEFLAQRLRPESHALALMSTGAGDQGSQLECEGYWNKKDLRGLGGCKLSDGSLFKYHASGRMVKYVRQ